MNRWDGPAKLNWLCICLTGRVGTVFRRLPEATLTDFKEAKKSVEGAIQTRKQEGAVPGRTADSYKKGDRRLGCLWRGSQIVSGEGISRPDG